MKRFFFWLLGVLLGVLLFLGVIVGFSWFSAGLDDLPDAEGTSFAGVPLERNGYCWQVPLIGALADRVMAESNTLTVQKLGVISDARPVLTTPDWVDVNQSIVTVRDVQANDVVFSGSLQEYHEFQYLQNSEYSVEMQLWRLPAGMTRDQLAKPTGKVARNPGLEQPARPVGWYGYRFNFTLEAAPQVLLSAEKIRQGDVVAVYVTGLVGDTPPTLKSELGTARFQKLGTSWVGYLGAAYNADVKKHTITVSMGDVESQVELRVLERRFGQAEKIAEQEPPEGAEEEFRKKIWPLYDAPSGPRSWVVAWEKPVQDAEVLMGYGMYQMEDGKQGPKSNSTVYDTIPGSKVITPTAGTVVFAGPLLLTGNTVVVDHGCGVRSYLYGLDEITVEQGSELAMNNPVGIAGETLTLDVKVGKKSVDPEELFHGNGGLFVVQ